jgi:hypothetical protein
VDPNHNSIFTHLRDSKWLKETYQLLKKRGYQIYSNWKRSGTIIRIATLACITVLLLVSLLFLPNISGQHNGDLKTLGGTSDWCHNFCDGNITVRLRYISCKFFGIGQLEVEAKNINGKIDVGWFWFGNQFQESKFPKNK